MNLKKTITALAVLLMVASPSFAVDVTVNSWDEYKALPSEGNNVTLGKEITAGATIELKGVSTLNLNNFAINGTSTTGDILFDGFSGTSFAISNGVIKNIEANVLNAVVAETNRPITISTVDFLNNGTTNSNSEVLGGLLRLSGNMTITNSLFENNYVISTSAKNIYGGIFALAGSDYKISDSKFKNNYILTDAKKARGGVIHNGAILSVKNALFEGNYVKNTGTIATNDFAQGGAIYNTNSLSIKDSVFKGNYTDASEGNAQGGAIYNSNSATIPSIDKSEFIENTAKGLGSAIYNAGTITSITNSNFEKNKSTITGSSQAYGAIYNATDGVITSISGNTFKNNTGLGMHSSDIYNNGGNIAAISNNKFETTRTVGSNKTAIRIHNSSAPMTIKNNKISGYTTGIQLSKNNQTVEITDTDIDDTTYGIVADSGTTIDGFTPIGELTIKADTKDVKYNNNTTALSISNLSSSTNTVNLTASADRMLSFNKIIFQNNENDGEITKFNINGAGTVLIDSLNKLSGGINKGKANIEISNGTLQVGKFGEKASNVQHLKNIDNLTISGGMLSTLNGHEDSISISTLKTPYGAISFDWGDEITSSDVDAGASLGAVNIYETPEIIASSAIKTIAGINSGVVYTYTNDRKYMIDANGSNVDNIEISYSASSTGGLAEALADTSPIVSFSLLSSYSDTNVNEQKSNIFNIFGNNAYDNENKDNGKTLTIGTIILETQILKRILPQVIL